jgi:hypothetical protein
MNKKKWKDFAVKKRRLSLTGEKFKTTRGIVSKEGGLAVFVFGDDTELEHNVLPNVVYPWCVKAIRAKTLRSCTGLY